VAGNAVPGDAVLYKSGITQHSELVVVVKISIIFYSKTKRYAWSSFAMDSWLTYWSSSPNLKMKTFGIYNRDR